MQQDDFITAVLDTVAANVQISKSARAKIDSALRTNWGGCQVLYISKKSPTMRQAIREAIGSHEEIARQFNVSRQTVWRVRKGR